MWHREQRDHPSDTGPGLKSVSLMKPLMPTSSQVAVHIWVVLSITQHYHTTHKVCVLVVKHQNVDEEI